MQKKNSVACLPRGHAVPLTGQAGQSDFSVLPGVIEYVRLVVLVYSGQADFFDTCRVIDCVWLAISYYPGQSDFSIPLIINTSAG